MKPKQKIIKITLCGPSDIEKEIKIAREVIDSWNKNHWESSGWGLKSQHWNTDAVPTTALRGQAAINHQLIDDSDIIVAVFWTRLGTPTGLAESGTVEEITRATARGIPVLTYFSEFEAPAVRYDQHQADRLAVFKEKMMQTTLSFTFKNKKKFRELFEYHLNATVQKLLVGYKKEKTRQPRSTQKTINQKAVGNSNVQIAGDGNSVTFKGATKRPKVTIERHPDHIESSDQKRVSDWIKELADESTGKPRGELIQDWWGKFYGRFNMASYKELKTDQLPEVEAWYRTQLNLIKADRKTTDPKSWRDGKYAAIKLKMKKMGLTEEAYYPMLSDRMNMKKPFTSLKKLSKHDLERVAGMVKRDYEKWNKS